LKFAAFYVVAKISVKQHLLEVTLRIRIVHWSYNFDSMF